MAFTLKDAIPLALHVVTGASRHDLGCGGGSQFMFIRGMTASGVLSHELDFASDHIRDFEYAAGHILSCLGNYRLTEDQFNVNLGVFVEHIKHLRLSLQTGDSGYCQLIRSADALPSLGGIPGPQSPSGDPSDPPPSQE